MRDDPTAQLSDFLLTWYDRHARVMPWRVSPADRLAGVRPDPYRIWLSEVMLQQTTVAAVRDYFNRFIQRWPTVTDLAAAPDGEVMGEWAGLGYYARARNLLKGARAVVALHDGSFPASRTQLMTLPGIGPYTAAAVAAIAFDAPVTVVDGNVERVMARMFAVQTPLPAAKAELTGHAAGLTPLRRAGDYAQAVMDLGATICTPRNPACGICPWQAHCLARRQGIQSDLPRKTPKPVKPVREGTAFVARRADGMWLLERRPDRGLLGGMLGWPGSDWASQPGPILPPVEAEWRALNTQVRHTFTHFHLRLSLQIAELPLTIGAAPGAFLAEPDFATSLPTVMRKAYRLAKDAFGSH